VTIVGANRRAFALRVRVTAAAGTQAGPDRKNADSPQETCQPKSGSLGNVFALAKGKNEHHGENQHGQRDTHEQRPAPHVTQDRFVTALLSAFSNERHFESRECQSMGVMAGKSQAESMSEK
jgi:hypothetical protein